MKRKIFLACMLACTLFSQAIDRLILVDHNEMTIGGDEILQLPGIGLGLRCGTDSVMILDNPELAAIQWIEPNDARSLVACGPNFYAAEGDSIYRVATETAPRKFIGRLDNEQFTLYYATDSTFYVCTADEDFSCVYEFNPADGTCMPYISMKAPILKLSTVGDNTVIWVDDQLLMTLPDGEIAPIFTSETLTDMQVTPIGIMAATADGLVWLTSPGKGAYIVREPMSRVWWDDADVLYYLTAQGDLHAVIGLMETYMQMEEK